MLRRNRLKVGLCRSRRASSAKRRGRGPLLRSVAKHSGMALLTVLDRTNANLTLARLQIERLDPLLDR